MPKDPPNPIQVEDEILQVLYWMEGEGLGRQVALSQLARFLAFPPEDVRQAAETLLAKGQLESVRERQELTVGLSETGRREGSRRFREEFESYLGHESHLVCDDPACDCHSPDWDGACAHLGRVH